MKRSQFLMIKIILMICFLMFVSQTAFASISLPWQSTFNCSEWNQTSGSPNCDGITSTGGAWTCAGKGEQITSAANYPGGKGGRGQRHWLGDHNVNSGGMMINFSSAQKEFWARWYVRFQAGMDTTGHTMMFKMLYLNGAGSSNIGYIMLPETGDQVYYYEQSGGHTIWRANSGGWYSVYGSGVSDGSWFRVDTHFKAETSGSNGIFQLWINGNLLINTNKAQFGSPGGFSGFLLGSNSKGHNDAPTPMYVDFDDIAINSTGYIGALSGSGSVSSGSGSSGSGSSGSGSTAPTVQAPAHLIATSSSNAGSGSNVGSGSGSTSGSTSNGGGSLLFAESFDNSNMASRGWYDNTNFQFSTTEHTSGSTSSAQFRFPLNATTPTSGGAMRKKFTASDSVYVSYYVKYSSNWQGSNHTYHPHEFYLLTNADSDYSGLADTHLTTYIEQNEGTPLIAIQDAQNIDQSRINKDLTGVTENRSVAGCNGSSDGYSDSCYSYGSGYLNWKQWKAGSIYFQDATGPRYKNDWHHIEAYVKLNSVTGGVANNDGIIRYWYDGNSVINKSNVVLRTGANPNMKFNQFVIAPYIGDGSPVDQTFWVDDLTLRTAIQ